MNEKIYEIIEKLPQNIARPLLFLSESFIDKICEIRLNINSFLIVSTATESYYLLKAGSLSYKPLSNAVFVTDKDINEAFLSLTNRSVFAHSYELNEGFLSLGNGCRAGVTGKFFNGSLIDVYSINIRIAREVKGAAESISGYLNKGLLIVGPPGSGKTTVLRDAVRILSEKRIRVSVIDSRQEITNGFNLGTFVDTVICYDKAKGVEMALRSMNPRVIVFDEIGNSAELKGVFDMFNAGVRIITTAHASSIEEIRQRNITKKLLDSGVIEHIALLSPIPGERIQLINKRDVLIEHT